MRRRTRPSLEAALRCYTAAQQKARQSRSYTMRELLWHRCDRDCRRMFHYRDTNRSSFKTAKKRNGCSCVALRGGKNSCVRTSRMRDEC
eukprot:3492273-Prymnesium_polylepis.2